MNRVHGMQIALMGPDHWQEVRAIYQQGIDTGQATFEKAPPESWEEWTAKFLADLSLVFLKEGAVLGWASVSPTSARKVYRGVGEVSLYVDQRHQRQGIGKALLDALIHASESQGFWTLQAGIFPENQPSIRLHLACGFRIVGDRKAIGRMEAGRLKGRWRDVLLLERRSRLVGIPG